MNTSRRVFLTTGAAATLAQLIPDALSARAFSTRPISLPLSETDQAVLAFAKTYGARVRFVGLGVLEKLRFGSSKHLRVLVEVSELAGFEAALASFPFPGAYAEGSQLSFEASGTEFTLENLPSRAFDERRSTLSKARYIAFAHDALSYDPVAENLADPFGAARAAAVRTVNRAFGSITGLEVILRGYIEAKQLDLRLGADFHSWKNRLLRLAARKKDAAAIVAGFLRQLATAAEVLPVETIKEILRSRSVKGAIGQAYGLDVEAAIAAYDALRASQSGSISNAAIWLLVLLRFQLQEESVSGVLSPLLQNGNRFQVLRSRQALAQARQLFLS
jgi:hypothetical protein